MSTSIAPFVLPDLAVVGLRVKGDQPPDPFQPPLPDGIHLRWAFAHRLGYKPGFPWQGFFLFRRDHLEPERRCFNPADLPQLSGPPLPGDPPEVRLHVQLSPGAPAIRAWINIMPLQDEPDLVVTGFAGPVPVIQQHVKASVGGQTRVELATPGLTAIGMSVDRFQSLEVCFVPGAFVRRGSWDRLPDCPFPIGLPLTHPDYPATGSQPEDRNVAEADGLSRVRYGPVNRWMGQPFADLYEQLTRLVKGGQVVPMADDARAVILPFTGGGAPGEVQPNPVKVHPLDLVLLGATHPAFAQILGLYWVDRTADPHRDYDYLVVADYTGSFKATLGLGINSAITNLTTMGIPGATWSLLDASQIDPGGSLPPPDWATAYRMPGGVARNSSGAQVYSGQVAGIRWDLGLTLGGQVLSGRPMAYLVWRTGNLGLAQPGAPPDGEQYALLTPDPLMVTHPSTAAGGPPQRPPGWPSFPLYFIDKALTPGWYSYGVTGIDIFGRHSRRGGPAAWRDWNPSVTGPTIWTYLQPPGETLEHPFAIRMQGVTPPPSPPGIEASALDPLDPYVIRDGAYNTWRTANLGITGLRVRWLWGQTQMLQAPDTVEFRVYYNPGTNLPANADQAKSWDQRLGVVAFANAALVTVDAAGGPLRIYETFLPAPASLAADLLKPVAYAHVTVTAADGEVSTADDPKWAGQPLGDRFGNEGPPGTPAKVFVVNRVTPPPPVPPPDSEKVFATPADYHSRSFYTYRWVAQPGLFAHVFRAVDEAVFQADLAHGPRPALNPAIPADRLFFPPQAVEPEWTDLRCQQAANAINAINPLRGNPAAALAAYRKLPNDALRVLAGLPGNERAFLQLTIKPLDPNAPENADRRGPDSPADYVPQPNLRAYIDTLDGRATNRYFYRSIYVDGAQNRSSLSLSSPPVWLPKVVPPRAPVITKVLGGDRQITLRWASNREADLAEYRVYRADTEASTRDLRLMTQVHTETVPAGDPATRPSEVVWTDTPLPGLVTLYYRLVAVDDIGNVSVPSTTVAGRAFDEALPVPPTPTVAWILSNGKVRAQVTWTSADETLLQRRDDGRGPWIDLVQWRPAGFYTIRDPFSDPVYSYEYRLWARKTTGAVAKGSAVTLAAQP